MRMGQWTNDDDWPIVAGINEPVDSNSLLAPGSWLSGEAHQLSDQMPRWG
jgi:hypothetical protein